MKEAEIRDFGSILEINDLTIQFGNKVILKEFSLYVASGKKVVITGESGRGKSTILRSILGFVRPVRGSISILGRLLTEETVWDLRRLMAYVPQEPDLGDGLLKNSIERPFSFRANSHLRDNLKRVPEFFRQFSLPMDLLDKRATSLSGGEKQRIALIIALLLNRDILLLDEPTSALDDKNSKRVGDFLFSLKETTVLCVSHNRDFIKMADQVIELN